MTTKKSKTRDLMRGLRTPAKPADPDAYTVDRGPLPRTVPRKPAEKGATATAGGPEPREFPRGVNKLGPSERFGLSIPGAGRLLMCKLKLLDPDFTDPAPENPRAQALLREDDPDIQALVASFEEQGQQQPALADRNPDTGRWEVIYGTRRRFAASIVDARRREEGGFPLIAWVPEEPGVLTPADRQTLAISENEDRTDLSSWEKGQLVAKLTEEGTLTDTAIAKLLRLSRNKLGGYRAMSEIPAEIVERLESPQLLTARGAERLAKLASEAGNYDTLLQRLPKAPERFASMPELLAAASPKKVEKGGLKPRGKQEIKAADGTTRFAVGRVRGAPGRLKIDAYGLDDDGIEAVLNALEKLAK